MNRFKRCLAARFTAALVASGATASDLENRLPGCFVPVPPAP